MTIYWANSSTRPDVVDVEVLEESALVMAQATIQNAINESGIKRAELARRMKCDRSFVSRMMSGNHNLTVKTMARSLAACGFEIRFQPVKIEWNWVAQPTREEVPANAGTVNSILPVVGLTVPTLALGRA